MPLAILQMCLKMKPYSTSGGGRLGRSSSSSSAWNAYVLHIHRCWWCGGHGDDVWNSECGGAQLRNKGEEYRMLQMTQKVAEDNMQERTAGDPHLPDLPQQG